MLRNIIEIPFCLVSFILYKSIRIVFGLVLYCRRSHPKLAGAWRPANERILNSRFYFFMMHVFGPRWNPHALVGGVGPLDVEREISFDIGELNASAKIWTIAVYKARSTKVITQSHSSEDSPSSQLVVPPGSYLLGIRMYDVKPDARFPAIFTDGVTTVEALEVSWGDNNFYRKLGSRGTWVGCVMHCYMFHLLRLRKWFPSSFVHREFLPVGGVHNKFYYGAIYKGQVLRMRLPEAVLSTHQVYYAFYNVSSLLTDWGQATESTYTTAPAKARGYYLVRLVCRETVESSVEKQCQFEVEASN